MPKAWQEKEVALPDEVAFSNLKVKITLFAFEESNLGRLF
jgi:hypothetical protein